MARPLAPWQAALDLQTAVASAARVLPRRRQRERVRLEESAAAVTHCLITGRVHAGTPREIALQHFRDAMTAALALGVGRDELVIAFNGDDER